MSNNIENTYKEFKHVTIALNFLNSENIDDPQVEARQRELTERQLDLAVALRYEYVCSLEKHFDDGLPALLDAQIKGAVHDFFSYRHTYMLDNSSEESQTELIDAVNNAISKMSDANHREVAFRCYLEDLDNDKIRDAYKQAQRDASTARDDVVAAYIEALEDGVNINKLEDAKTCVHIILGITEV